MCHKFVSPDEPYEAFSTFFTGYGGMEINATNIRIWIHEKDIGNLERVVWEGFGHLLVGQTSSHAKIRKFLDVVPKLMNEIKDVHTAAVYGDINGIASNEYRQPIYTSKDINGIPAFHKAVGNGHKEVAEHFMEKTDRSVLNLTDRHGRYALHYAAGIAAEDDKAMYNWLIEYGAEDHKADELLKVPMYYIDHPNKIKYSNCSLIPDAPRQSSPKKESRSGSSPEKSPVKSKSRSLSQAKRRSAETDKENHPVNRASKTNQGIPEWNLITKEHISKWIKTADLTKVEQAVYLGQGKYMRGRTAWNEEMRKFLVTVPNIMSSIEDFHALATEGNVEKLERLMSSDRKLIVSRDTFGRTALHKAALDGQVEIVEKLLNGDLSSAGDLARAKDKEFRTPFHYAARCDATEDREKIFEILEKAGASSDEVDSAGHDALYYVSNEFPKAKAKSVDDEDTDGEIKGLIKASKPETNGEIKGLIKASKPETNGVVKIQPEGVISDEVSEEIIAMAVEKKDWEKMVEFILNGEGDRLFQRKSEDEEVQEFLDNITAFQEKIQLINKAIESGSLRALQNQLDRKKFALARDRGTGVNFLQKALILGHTDILRYLASNFPKILLLKDNQDRTALHYAAAVKDDAHLYRILESTGSDKLVKDKSGNSPEFYLQHKEKLSLKELQENVEHANFHSDPPHPKLGDEIANKVDQAKDWMNHMAHEIKAHALKGHQINSFDEAYESSEYEEDGAKNERLDQETVQRLNTAHRRLLWARECQSLLKRFLTQKVFHRLQMRRSTEGGTLQDVIQSGAEVLDTKIGVFAPDRDSYKVFWPLFKPIIASLHHCHGPNLHQPKLEWADAKKFGDLGSKMVQKVEFVAVRSLSEYPFGPILRTEEYREMEKTMRRAFDRMDGEFEGKYHPLKNLTPEAERHLKEIGAYFDDADPLLKAGKLHRDWPLGRGVFITKNVFIQVNQPEHLKIIVRESNDRFRDAYELFLDVLEFFEDECLRSKFAYDSKLGFVTLSPEWLGTGLRIMITVELKRIEAQDLEDICAQFYLDKEHEPEPSVNVKLWNKRTFGISEAQIISDVFYGVKRIIELEMETVK